MAPKKVRPDKECPGCQTMVPHTTFYRHKRRLEAGQRCSEYAPRQPGVDTPDGTKFQCSVCKRLFHNRATRWAHEMTHKEGSNYGVADFHCEQCNKHFDRFSSLYNHNLMFHTEFNIYEMTQHEMQMVNPFKNNTSLSIRGEVPVSLTDEGLKNLVAAYLKWIKRYSHHQESMNSHPIHVYIGARLGPNFPGGTKEEIVAFIKARLAEVGWYVGINSEMRVRGDNINSRHKEFPETSPLGRGGLAGEVVICAHTWPVGNSWDLRESIQLEGRGFEAGIINYLKTLTSFTSPEEIPINLLNERDECGSFSNCLLPEEQEEFITDGVSGRPFVCIEDVCDGNCGAVFHLDPAKIKIHNIQPKERPTIPGLNVSGGSTRPTGSSIKIQENPKPRPSEPEEIQLEVKQILLDLNTKGERMMDEEAYVYTVILPSRVEFPDTISARTVVKRIAKGQSDGPTPYYIGEGRNDGMDSHHRTGITSVVAKTAHLENRRVIVMSTFACGSLPEARKLEARLLIHAFLQVRKNFDSHHFNPLNKNFPWTWLEYLNDDEIKEAIELGIKGIPPFIQSGNEIRMKDVQFPISIVEALRAKSVKEIYQFDNQEDSDDEDCGSDDEFESEAKDEEEQF